MVEATIYTEEEVVRIVEECRGNAAKVANVLGVSRATVMNYMKRWPSVREAFVSARQSVIDGVENVLYDKAMEGEAWAVCFFLKTQAKDRGYTEVQRVESVSMHIDVAKLSDEQLRALAGGADPSTVLAIGDESTVPMIEGEARVLDAEE